MSTKGKCDSCIYWTEYKNRVFARVTGKGSDFARNIIELRPCSFELPPRANQDGNVIYTDQDHTCSEFSQS